MQSLYVNVSPCVPLGGVTRSPRPVPENTGSSSGRSINRPTTIAACSEQGSLEIPLIEIGPPRLGLIESSMPSIPSQATASPGLIRGVRCVSSEASTCTRPRRRRHQTRKRQDRKHPEITRERETGPGHGSPF